MKSVNQLIGTVAGLAIAMSVASSAFAGDPRIELANNTGATIYAAQMSDVGRNNWGPDLLGDNVLPSGYSIVLHPENRGYCKYDLRVTFADGSSNTVTRLNACETYQVSFNPRRDARITYINGGTETLPVSY
jgi:hypothetical protein